MGGRGQKSRIKRNTSSVKSGTIVNNFQVDSMNNSKKSYNVIFYKNDDGYRIIREIPSGSGSRIVAENFKTKEDAQKSYDSWKDRVKNNKIGKGVSNEGQLTNRLKNVVNEDMKSYKKYGDRYGMKKIEE